MMGWALELTLETTGRLTLGEVGSRSMALLTALVTSWVAASTSRLLMNSMLMALTPKELWELMERIPSMALRLSSRGLVMVLSTVSGLAPVYSVVTETTGPGDVGVLAHRQGHVGGGPHQQDQQTDDPGQHRPLDGEVGEDHGRPCFSGGERSRRGLWIGLIGGDLEPGAGMEFLHSGGHHPVRRA